MFSGIFSLPWWGYVVVTLVFTHITIAAVTIYLHRHSAHRALDLHPVISHFFRLWLWLTTGMETKQWTAVHRKHHARCETEEDPHSPVVLGIEKVMWQGADLYKLESKNAETLEKFGQGTPDDWMERNIYSSHSVAGIATMMIINLALFGFIGLTIWAVQMMWIPFFAAGIINGVGHYWGYRNFQAEDASRNIVPWGILIGGEELHNNHHAYPSSAQLSNKWWEFDIGWMYIRTMEILGLARVKKVAPKVMLAADKTQCDQDTLHAVIQSRYDVLTKYARSVKQTCADEIAHLKTRAVRVDRSMVKRWLQNDEQKLSALERERMKEVLSNSKTLHTVYSMRQELTSLWQRSTANKDELVRQLEDWCHRAEASGIVALQDFSKRLRRYQLARV
ncbi:MAG: fatty acid desaturase [Betaproteobacteria bacterium]|nr:fatty acid desaturase [Betaproteobacteria bacterium]